MVARKIFTLEIPVTVDGFLNFNQWRPSFFSILTLLKTVKKGTLYRKQNCFNKSKINTLIYKLFVFYNFIIKKFFLKIDSVRGTFTRFLDLIR